MKKIINGRLYNTETAKKLAEFQSSRPCSDFEYFEEALYQKRTGEYFLAGRGNALSKYSKSDGDSLCSGERITPISYDQAQQWAERHISADSYIKLFGDPEDDITKQTVTYSLSASAVQKIKREAAKQAISASEFIEQLISKIN